MKIINKPTVAMTTKEVTKLRELQAKNPICNIINCDNFSCIDCPFNKLSDQLDNLICVKKRKEGT